MKCPVRQPVALRLRGFIGENQVGVKNRIPLWKQRTKTDALRPGCLKCQSVPPMSAFEVSAGRRAIAPRAHTGGNQKGTPPMSKFHNLSLATKFALAFGMVCCFCLALGTYTWLAMRSISEAGAAVGEDDFPSVVSLVAARTAINQVRAADLEMLLCHTPECFGAQQTLRAQGISDFQAALRTYEPFDSSDTERALTHKFSAAFAGYQEASNRAVVLLAAGKRAEASDLLAGNSTELAIQQALSASNDDIQFNVQEGRADSQSSTDTSRRAVWINLAATIALIVLCAATGWLLTRLIAPRIARATVELERMARKDLTAHVRVLGTDEIGRLGVALNTCADSVRAILQSVAQGAATLAASTTAISTAASQTANNARTQSGKTTQIAAASQEMTATIGEISRNAEQAATASRESARVADQGGAVMQSATATMEKIAASSGTVSERMASLAHRSEEIGKVVSVIQEISEQTNLLALNAAIESARAGVHGRGFAVVAGEVRRLAERTKGATEEIAATIRSIQEESRQTLELMQESQSAVNTGIQETSRARQSLTAIIDASRQVEQQIQMIATAATEQTSASEEISHSASEISQLSAENTRGAQQTVETLRGLASLVSDLDGMIHQFHLEAAVQPTVPVAAKISSVPLPRTASAAI
jgi:methyl-accepting chemotaxis protein